MFIYGSHENKCAHNNYNNIIMRTMITIIIVIKTTTKSIK